MPRFRTKQESDAVFTPAVVFSRRVAGRPPGAIGCTERLCDMPDAAVFTKLMAEAGIPTQADSIQNMTMNGTLGCMDCVKAADRECYVEFREECPFASLPRTKMRTIWTNTDSPDGEMTLTLMCRGCGRRFKRMCDIVVHEKTAAVMAEMTLPDGTLMETRMV